MKRLSIRRNVLRIIVVGLLSLGSAAAPGQIPGLPVPPSTKPAPEPSKGKVATTEGKIEVQDQVTDPQLETAIEGLLIQYPGVRKVDIGVDRGFVTIRGQVDDDDTHDEITEFVRRVEGVRLVLNLMVTDEEVMSSWSLAERELKNFIAYFSKYWLLMLLAVGVLMVTATLARWFNKYSETLLAPFLDNLLLRSVVGSVLSGLIMIGGLLLALYVLKLTHAVLSILGLAGVVGLAVGFAFKDITENFMASVLLGIRRPFRIGDSIQVAGHSGVVQSLNTRATVLVTIDGKHVRIPNAIIYKETVVNTSAWPRTRGEFEVVIPYEASTSDAQSAMASALSNQDGILADPAPQALVEALEPGGVRIKATFWSENKGIDHARLQSEAKLKTKVALQAVGIFTPTKTAVSGVSRERGETSDTITDAARDNLERDTKAAAHGAAVASCRVNSLAPGLLEGETHVEDEGINLLQSHKSEAASTS